MDIRNRIKEFRDVTPAEVQNNPGNWRTHPEAQKQALRGILGEVGIAGVVTAYHSTRHGGLTLIDGHERMTVGVPFPAIILDVDDSEADKLLLTIDPIAGLAGADTQLLDTLFRNVDTGDAALSQMWSDLAKSHGLYEPEPKSIDELAAEFGEPDPTAFWPAVKLKVAPETHAQWNVHRENFDDDNQALLALLQQGDTTGDTTLEGDD